MRCARLLRRMTQQLGFVGLDGVRVQVKHALKRAGFGIGGGKRHHFTSPSKTAVAQDKRLHGFWCFGCHGLGRRVDKNLDGRRLQQVAARAGPAAKADLIFQREG